MIFDRRNYSSFKFISLFALLCVCFLNIFFYRLAEHGTDRSGQVLTFLVIAILITIISEKYKNNKTEIFKICSVILVLLISLKTFYLLYAPLILLVFLDKSFRGKFINLLIQKSSIFSIIFLSIAIFLIFLNTGCLVYPAVFTCFDSLYWSFPEKNCS